MKYYSLLLFLVFHFSSIAQDCPSSSITLRTQQDVDDFHTNYPNCTELPGNLIINSQGLATDPVTSLAGLAQLRSIKGYLELRYLDSLKNLDGLHQLVTVDVSILIWNCFSLKNIILDSLQNINRNLKIQYNYSLQKISFSNLKQVPRNLIVTSNYNLSAISGFNQLTTLAEDIRGTLRVSHNYSLTKIDGFNKVTTVGSLQIRYNKSLKTFAGFENLKSVTSSLELSGLDSLTNFSAVKNLETILWQFEISEMNGLTNLNHFPNLKNVNNIYLNENNELSKISFPELTDIETLSMDKNPKITSLTGFPKLATIGSIQISNHESLTDLAGLNKLGKIGRGLFLSNCPIEKLSSLTKLTEIRILSLENTKLKNLADLENLKILDKSIVLINNEELESIDEIKQVRGFNSVETSIYLKDNPKLKSIAAIGSLNYNNLKTVHITGSPLLSNCSLINICKSLSAKSSYRTVHTFSDNATGCNDNNEILENCKAIDRPIAFHPTLVQSTINLISEIDTEIIIFNTMGQILLQENIFNGITSIDLSILPSGIYFIQEKGGKQQKFFKQ
ncbi:MAG: T9SS type A sorting domain-containing protein [Saprospiraceae bacterium]